MRLLPVRLWLPGGLEMVASNFNEDVPLPALPGVPPLPPLGVWEDVLWQPRTIDLAPGWGLFFYTDGLVEGRIDNPPENALGQRAAAKSRHVRHSRIHSAR